MYRKGGLVMRRLLMILLVLPLLGLMSCVKQKNCDCSQKGKFVYFENKKTIIYCGYDHQVNAAFFSTEREDAPLYIVGYIPVKFRTKDTLNVDVCLEEETKGVCLAFGEGSVYKLKCIEKKD